MKTKITSLMLLAVALLTVVVSGCRNTAHGVGADMERAGERIQDKTER